MIWIKNNDLWNCSETTKYDDFILRPNNKYIKIKKENILCDAIKIVMKHYHDIMNDYGFPLFMISLSEIFSLDTNLLY